MKDGDAMTTTTTMLETPRLSMTQPMVKFAQPHSRIVPDLYDVARNGVHHVKRQNARVISGDFSDNDSVNSMDTEPVQKGMRKSTSATRPRLRHAQGDVKRVLRKALGAYKVRMVCVNPFPNEMEEANMEDDTWEEVCQEMGIDLPITDDNRLTVSCATCLRTL